MMSKSLCRICKKPTGKKANAFYCEDCRKVLLQKGGYRYKIKDGVYVWSKRIFRCVVDGKDITPIIECYEVVD